MPSKLSSALGALLFFSLCAVSAVGCADDAVSSETGTDDVTGAMTIRVPVLAYEDGTLLSKHNAQLAAAGLGTFPDVVEFEIRNGQPNDAAVEKWNAASRLVDEANDRLNLQLEMRDWAEPSDYQTNDPATSLCYRGDGRKAMDAVQSLAGGVAFSDQLSVHGWRYKQVKYTYQDLSEEDELEFPAIWQEWRGDGEAVLAITASSDGGEEMNPGLIYKCR